MSTPIEGAATGAAGSSRLSRESGLAVWQAHWHSVLLWIGVAAALVAPGVLQIGSYTMYLASLTVIYILMASGLNLMMGYARMFSMAQVAFMGLGSYCVAIGGLKWGWPFWLALAVAVVIAAVAAAVVGFAALRLSLHALALLTLGIVVIFNLVATNAVSLTGGTLGLAGIARPALLGWSFRTDSSYEILCGVVAWIALLAFAVLTSGTWGRAYRAVYQNELRGASVGINVTAYKLLAFVVGSIAAAVAGALYAPLVGYVDPTSFPLSVSVLIVVMVVVGGSGRLAGGIIGAVVVTLLPEALRGTASLYLFIFGLATLAIILFAPQGIAGAAAELGERLRPIRAGRGVDRR